MPDRVTGVDLVLVEDILSAARVGRIARTVSILGTNAGQVLDRIWSDLGLRDNPTIVVWLDGDKAGRKGRNALARALSLQGANVLTITTPLDPKKYSYREIREILRDRLSDATADEVPEGLQAAIQHHP